MRRFFYFLLFFTLPLQAASRLTGLVIDKQSGKPLSGANVLLAQEHRGVVTDQQGRFTLMNVAPGAAQVLVSYIGYQPYHGHMSIAPDAELFLTIALSPMMLNLADMVVTSPKIDKQLRDIALPLTVVRAEKIATQAPVSIANILQNEPGIAMGRDGIWGTFISIRGLSRNTIVTLIDGNRIDTANDLAAGLSMMDVNDIEQIEVIKGAASSLYGSGAMGGVINIITKSGWYQDKAYLKMNLTTGYASVNQAGLGRVQVNVGHRNWYGYFSSMMRKAGDAKTPSGTLDSQYKDDNYSSRLSVKPFNHQEINLSYQKYNAHDVGMPGGYPIFPNNARVRYPVEKRELFSAEYRLSDLSSHWLRTSIKYYYQDILRHVENLPYIVNNVPAAGGQPPKRVSVLKISPGATHTTNGVQIQNNWLWGNGHYVVWGIDAWQKDYRGFRTKESIIEVLNPVSGAVQKTISKTVGELPIPDAYYRSMGVYGQYEQRFFHERLQTTLGARYDRIQVENKQALNPLYEITDGVRNNTPAGQTIMWSGHRALNHSWSSNMGLLYLLAHNFDVTLNLAHSFRSPFLEERFQYIDLGNLLKVGDPFLKPETGNFMDWGCRYITPSLQLYANIFYNRLQNMVGEIPGRYENRNALIKTNIGKAELYGAEMSQSTVLSDHLSVWSRASYVRGNDLLVHQPLAQIPPFNGGLGVQIQVSNWGTVDAAATIYDGQERIVSGEFKTPGYVYYDIYVNSRAVRWGAWSGRLMIGCENVTDKDYRNHLATNRGLITSEPGRNFLARYQMEF